MSITEKGVGNQFQPHNNISLTQISKCTKCIQRKQNTWELELLFCFEVCQGIAVSKETHSRTTKTFWRVLRTVYNRHELAVTLDVGSKFFCVFSSTIKKISKQCASLSLLWLFQKRLTINLDSCCLHS